MSCMAACGVPLLVAGFLFASFLWSRRHDDPPPVNESNLPDPGPRWGDRQRGDTDPSEGIRPALDDVTESPPEEP